MSHLLAVSGLHLAMLAALGYAAARAGLRRRPPGGVDARRVALALALLGATAYAGLAGFGTPVRRALVLLGSLGAAAFARRPLRRGAPLATAALAILALDPGALFDAGAQLSFAASAALILAAGRRRTEAPSRRARGRRAPVTALAFGSVAPWGLVANVVAVPWTGFVLLPVALASAVAAALAPQAVPVGLAVRAAAQLAAGSLTVLSSAAARLPGAWPAQPAPGWAAAAIALAGLVVRARRTRWRVGLTLAITALLAAAPPARVGPAPPRLVALDVGQGDAIVVQGARAALLVDAGPAVPGGWDLGAAAVVPALRALGIRRLALAVASHADADHQGGLGAVLRAVPTERLWLPRGGATDPAFAALRAVAHARGVRVEERDAASPEVVLGDLRVAVLGPPAAVAPAAGDNDRSLVLRVAVGGRTVLLPGDLEAPAEAALIRAGAPLRADVLKLAHHGSRTSSTHAWLEDVGGAVAIASAPRAGRFGMPHPEVVARAEAAGYAVWWTGRDGAVLVALGPRLWVRGWRGQGGPSGGRGR